jgi:Flp pilus assembly protein TadG
MFRFDKGNVLTRKTRAFARRILRRFRRRDDGSVAVEFALVALPFLALLFAIMETAIVFFAGQTLETAAADSARLILTGQAQKQGLTQAQFKEEVCKRIRGLFDCENGVQVDVRTYSSFSAMTSTKPLDANGNINLTPTYQPGGPGDIVLVRLIYPWRVYLSLPGLNLADMPGGKRLLLATAAFRNEPYQ